MSFQNQARLEIATFSIKKFKCQPIPEIFMQPNTAYSIHPLFLPLTSQTHFGHRVRHFYAGLTDYSLYNCKFHKREKMYDHRTYPL